MAAPNIDFTAEARRAQRDIIFLLVVERLRYCGMQATANKKTQALRAPNAFDQIITWILTIKIHI
jgi:hypothetical protein